jgi:AbrB family looped-hinge helix DNA binding protein
MHRKKWEALMIIGTVSSKGQITIPKKIREFLDVETSDKLVFTPLENGKVLIASKRNPGSSLFGMLKHRRLSKPVSLKEMDFVIQMRRAKRMLR